MQLDQDGKVAWIADRRANAAAGDEVEYVEQMRMPNFTGKTLKKSFDKIVLCSEDQVAPVCSIVTAEGRLETDRDIGYGYGVLVEDASFGD